MTPDPLNRFMSPSPDRIMWFGGLGEIVPDTVSYSADDTESEELTPSFGTHSFSFDATASGELLTSLLFPRTRLPRKMKKAVKTMFYKRSKRDVELHFNPTPRTKWQRKVKRKCEWNEIMTPKGEKLIMKFV